MDVRAAQAAFTWQPTAHDIARANITRFMRLIGADRLEDLWELAHHDIASFYARLIDHLDLAWFTKPTTALDLSRGIPFARWFPGALFNASYNCLDRHIALGRGADPAILYESENGTSAALSFEALLAEEPTLSWDEAVAQIAGREVRP